MSKTPVRTMNSGFMDAISLPVLDAESSPRQAFAEMKRAKRGGLLVCSASEARLLMAHDIAGLTQKRGGTLKDIIGTPVHVFDLTPVANCTPEPYISTDALLNALKTSGRKVGLLSAPTGGSKHAIIYTLGDFHTMFKEPGPDRPKKNRPKR